MKKMEFGEIVIDLAPDEEKDNSRNSEGAFIELKDNKVLFIYSGFRGKSAVDFATADLAMIIFNQNMDKIDEKIILKCEIENAINVMSVSLLRMNNNDIGMFYLVRKNRSDLKMYFRRSADEGKTWGERTLCTSGEDVFVINNDRVIRLSNGRILIPAAAHPITGEGYCERAEMTFFYSDDDGMTWNEVKNRIDLPNYSICRSGLQEPGVIELKTGQLMAWARTDLGRQYQAFSDDYGEHWSQSEPSVFTSPCSPLSMKLYRDDIIAIWNPVPEYNGRDPVTKYFLGGRCPFVIGISNDNGRSFSEPLAFETDRSAGYCYCAVYFTEQYMLLAYSAGGIEDKSCLARCRIRKIHISELDKIIEIINKNE